MRFGRFPALLLSLALVSFATMRAVAAEMADTTHYNTSEGMPDLAKLKFHETPTGLKYAILSLGDDLFTPGEGQTVVVNYTGWLLDGRKFDSSLDAGRPFHFPIGTGKVIKGWDEGVAMMGKGAKWVLLIPSELAYGKRGQPRSKVPIPPNATLVFEVELLDIQ